MESIQSAYDIALQTLKTLEEALLDLENSPLENKYYLYICDAIIQRFEYSIDNFWKFLKLYMLNILQIPIESSSPRSVLRDALDAKVITKEEFESLLDGINCRNITSHAYNKDFAHKILEDIPHFYETMIVILERLKK